MATLISDKYEAWKAEANERFDQLKANEEELNRIFAEIYDMVDEVPIEEKVHHLADQMIAIDLDDGVKVNYAKFEDVLVKIK